MAQTKANELKPCPFCGGKAELHHNRSAGGIGLDGYFVKCTCNAEGAFDFGQSGAIEAWNNRPVEDALQACITEPDNLQVNEVELKPCPFCGSDEVTVEIRRWQDSEGYWDKMIWVECPYCNGLKPEKWNTRPIEAALRARVAELEADAERLAVALMRVERCGEDKSALFYTPICPICASFEDEEHALDCVIGIALAAHKANQEPAQP
jgi:Lar family restriction alleviation protein